MFRSVLVATLCGTGALLVACGSDAASSSSPAPPAVDGCLVGAWRTASITASLTAAGEHAQLAGGGGEVLTIAASGSVTVDDSRTAPIEGAAADGTAFKVVQSGTGIGHLTTASGTLTVTLEDPSRLTTAISRNGVQVATQHPGPETATYTCSSGARLTITSSGGTVSQYTPAG